MVDYTHKDYKFLLKCDGLLNQNKKIGNDSIGHRCIKDAHIETITGVLLCHDCYMLFMQGSPDLSISKPYGREFQIRLLNKILRGDLNGS